MKDYKAKYEEQKKLGQDLIYLIESASDSLSKEVLLSTECYEDLRASLTPSREEIASLLERYLDWIKEDGLNARVGHFMDIESHEEWFNHAITELRKPTQGDNNDG